MVPTAYLKAFEPVDAFPDEERAYWRAYVTQGTSPGPARPVFLSPTAEVGSAIATAVAEREEADVVERDGRLFVCPHRALMRLFASVLAFRRSIPAEAVPAFIATGQVERVAEELERLRAEHPAWRNHILQSTWEVPIRWFVLFDDSERRFDGGSIRYETTMATARARARKALSVLRPTLPNPTVVGLVAEMLSWLEQFHGDSRVVLEYGGVAALFDPDDLEHDHSALEVWSAIGALEEGDPERATAFYAAASERWAPARARESAN